MTIWRLNSDDCLHSTGGLPGCLSNVPPSYGMLNVVRNAGVKYISECQLLQKKITSGRSPPTEVHPIEATFIVNLACCAVILVVIFVL